MKKLIVSSLCLFALLTLMATSSQAHFLWLNIDNYHPRPNEAVHIEIGWGHKFPKDEMIKEKFLNEVYVLDSKSAKLPVKRISQTEFEFVPRAEGAYTVSATIRPGFLSKTTEGYRLQSKKGLKNVVSCLRFDIRAKAIINVGDHAQKPDKIVRDPLEIVPLKNPNCLEEGESLPLRVIYAGKPLPYAEVRATYAGFSDQPNTFAYATKADKDGVARIKILKRGSWLMKVEHEVAYPDPEECDKYRYSQCLTFEVR